MLELTSQLVRDLDFGIGREGSRRIIAGFVVVEFSLEHGGPVCRKVRAHWSAVRRVAYCVSKMKSPFKTDPEAAAQGV